MNKREIKRFLPGDLLELSDGSDLLVLSIEPIGIGYLRIKRDEPLFYRGAGGYRTGTNLQFSGWLTYDRTYEVPDHVEKIYHLFDFNLYNSAICQESVCFPRQITGECSGCPLGSVLGQPKTLYLPGDEVFVRILGIVKKIETVCLVIKRLGGDGENIIFRPGCGEIYYTGAFLGDVFSCLDRDDLTLHDAWDILKSGEIFPTTLRYYFEKQASGWWGEDFRLRCRGNNRYLKDTDLDTICEICIYQDSDKCIDCSITGLKIGII